MKIRIAKCYRQDSEVILSKKPGFIKLIYLVRSYRIYLNFLM